MQPDVENLSDAILTKLRDYGWIGPLVRKGVQAATLPRTGRAKRTRRPSVAVPTGLCVPQGVMWDSSVGRFVSRIWMSRRDTLRLGGCGPCQEDLDRLGEMWVRAREMRDEGLSKAEIREELGL